MGRMRLAPQRIEEKNVQPAQLGHAFFGNGAEVSEISCSAKAERCNGGFPVHYPDGLEDSPKELDRTGDTIHLHPRAAGVIAVRIKDVCEHPFDDCGGFVVRIHRNLARMTK